MRCAELEERIARYVGGDLAPVEAAAIEQHLRVCAGCADLARGLEDDRAWLASRPPETADVDFAAMRRQIRCEISRPRRGWKWLAVAAAILLAVGVGTTLRRAPVSRRPLPPVAARKVAVERQAVTEARPKGAVAHRTVRRARPKLPLSEPESPVEIRIATNDPNVTIILLHEYRGAPQ
jgi:anti-sigma factor RsiW